MLRDHIEIPEGLIKRVIATGSRHMCSPPVMDTDEDYLIYTVDHFMLTEFIISQGFKAEGGDSYEIDDEGFQSFRRDSVNILVTSDINFYEKFRNATVLCQKLNLLNKVDRISLFQFILYGNL